MFTGFWGEGFNLIIRNRFGRLMLICWEKCSSKARLRHECPFVSYVLNISKRFAFVPKKNLRPKSHVALKRIVCQVSISIDAWICIDFLLRHRYFIKRLMFLLWNKKTLVFGTPVCLGWFCCSVKMVKSPSNHYFGTIFFGTFSKHRTSKSKTWFTWKSAPRKEDSELGYIIFRFHVSSYCWWFRNPANQLRLVVYPIIYRVSYIPGG